MNSVTIVSCFLAKTRGRGCYLKMLRPPWSICRQYVSDGVKTSAAVDREADHSSEDIHLVDLKAGKSKHFIMNKDSSATLLFHQPTKTLVSVTATSINSNKSSEFQFVAKDITEMVSKVCKNETSNSVPNEGNGETKPNTINLVDVVKASELDCYKQGVELKQLPQLYMMLSKVRLTGLVVATEIVGYLMAPNAFDYKIFLLAAIGTALLSSAANTINQFFEVPFDSQMARTKNRVLVRAVITPLHAATFACVCASTGLTMMYLGINGLTALLGAFNLILYTSIYTPMKRMSIANTWVGSVVGAVPPLIGWTACTGTIDAGALVLGAILFAWQFPHFNALSWNLRGDYSRAGYRMMSVTDPHLCRVTALRYSVAMVGLCSVAAPLLDLTTYTFALDSLPFNAYLVYLSWRFYQRADSDSSRKLFRFSLIHLPAIMMLMIISKKHYGKKKASQETPS